MTHERTLHDLQGVVTPSPRINIVKETQIVMTTKKPQKSLEKLRCIRSYKVLRFSSFSNTFVAIFFMVQRPMKNPISIPPKSEQV